MAYRDRADRAEILAHRTSGELRIAYLAMARQWRELAHYADNLQIDGYEC
jgi:hypothetical protein